MTAGLLLIGALLVAFVIGPAWLERREDRRRHEHMRAMDVLAGRRPWWRA